MNFTTVQEGLYNNSTTCINPTIEQWLITSFAATISIVYLILYLFCLYLIALDKVLQKHPFYKMVLHLGVIDIIQLISLGQLTPFFTVMCLDMAEPFSKLWWFGKVVGAFANSSWLISVLFAHIITLNRMITICFRNYSEMIFSIKHKIWFCGCFVLLGYLLPQGATVTYFPSAFCWDYNDFPGSQMARSIEFPYDIANISIMAFWYICIMIKLKLQKNQVSAIQSSTVEKKELVVLAQAILICTAMLLAVIGFFVVPPLFNNRWANYSASLLWITCAGQNPLIYLCLNSSLRRKALISFGRNVSPKTKITPSCGSKIIVKSENNGLRTVYV